jgi:hypothetical protein
MWIREWWSEANLRLMFYPDDRRTIDGVDCIQVEADIN